MNDSFDPIPDPVRHVLDVQGGSSRDALASVLVRCALFVAGAIGIGWVLHDLRLEVAHPEPGAKKRIESLLERAPDLRILTVGNSHGSAVHQGSVGRRNGSIWLLAEDVWEIESQLEYLLPRMPQLDTLLFTASFGTLYHDNANTTHPSRDTVRRFFYAQPPGYPMIDGDWVNWFEGRMTTALVRPDHWEPVFAPLFAGADATGGDAPGGDASEEDASDEDGTPRIVARDREPMTHARLAEDAATNVLPRHAEFEENMLELNPDVVEDTTAVLRRVVAMCRERGVRVVFFTPPYSRPYLEGVDPAQRATLARVMAELSATDGVEYHDFSDEEAIAEDPTNFVNADHLSAKGAEAFTKLRLRPLVGPNAAGE